MDANGVAKEAGQRIPVTQPAIDLAIAKLDLGPNDVLIVNTSKASLDTQAYINSSVQNPVLGVRINPGEEIQDALVRWPKDLIITILEELKK